MLPKGHSLTARVHPSWDISQEISKDFNSHGLGIFSTPARIIAYAPPLALAEVLCASLCEEVRLPAHYGEPALCES